MVDRLADGAVRLQELIRMEVADIVATAHEQGFSATEALAALNLAVSASLAALEQGPDPAEDPATLI